MGETNLQFAKAQIDAVVRHNKITDAASLDRFLRTDVKTKDDPTLQARWRARIQLARPDLAPVVAEVVEAPVGFPDTVVPFVPAAPVSPIILPPVSPIVLEMSHGTVMPKPDPEGTGAVSPPDASTHVG